MPACFLPFGSVGIDGERSVVVASVRTLFFYERRIRVVKFQFAFCQITGAYECAQFYSLMHSEIVGNQSVLVNGKPVSSVEVARQGENRVVFSWVKPFSSGALKPKWNWHFRFADNWLSRLVPLDANSSGQGITVYTFQFYLGTPDS